VRVEVKPMNGTELKQVGFECDDLYFDFKNGEYIAPITCKAILYNSYSGDASITKITMNARVDSQDLERALSVPWSVSAPEAIPAGGYGTVIFSTTAKVYGTLDGINLIKDLWGLSTTITILYDVHWEGTSEEISSFEGSDIMTIHADWNDVVLDYGGDALIAITLAYYAPEAVIVSATGWKGAAKKAGVSILATFLLNEAKNWIITNWS